MSDDPSILEAMTREADALRARAERLEADLAEATDGWSGTGVKLDFALGERDEWARKWAAAETERDALARRVEELERGNHDKARALMQRDELLQAAEARADALANALRGLATHETEAGVCFCEDPADEWHPHGERCAAARAALGDKPERLPGGEYIHVPEKPEKP